MVTIAYLGSSTVDTSDPDFTWNTEESASCTASAVEEISSDGTTVELRSPLLGDIRTPHAKALYRRSRSQILFGFKYTSEYQTLRLQFANIKRSTVQGLLALMKAAAGQPLTLTLDDATVWVGYLMNDPFETIQVGKQNSSFELHFEGIKQ